MNPEFAITIRAKKLGILLKDARLTSGKTMTECGESLGISGSTISAYERGNSSPSLPELEILSHQFKVPIGRFWKDKTIAAEDELSAQLVPEIYIANRQKQIGEKLETAREALGKTYEEITEETGITYGRMKRFEAGETPIPLPELELLTNSLEFSLHELFETETLLGQWIAAQSSVNDFMALPAEIQEFITKPINQPYLEIAIKLSRLSAEELRGVAETLLEITI